MKIAHHSNRNLMKKSDDCLATVFPLMCELIEKFGCRTTEIHRLKNEQKRANRKTKDHTRLSNVKIILRTTKVNSILLRDRKCAKTYSRRLFEMSFIWASVTGLLGSVSLSMDRFPHFFQFFSLSLCLCLFLDRCRVPEKDRCK